MKKKVANAKIAKLIAENENRFLDKNDRISWPPLVKFIKGQLPELSLEYNRIRGVYRALKAGTYDVALASLKMFPESNDDKHSVRFKRDGDKGEGHIRIASEINPMMLNLDEIVEIFHLDLKVWRCVGFTTKAWQTAMKDKEKGFVQPTNWGIQARFALRTEYVPIREDFGWIFKDFKKAARLERGKIRERKGFAPDSNSTFVPMIFDLHLGKLAWAGETGENYDLKIAYTRGLTIFKKLIDRAALEGFDKVIFAVGNDFFQADDDKSQTTHGTRVDTETRWQKLFQKGVDLLKEMITYASGFSHVDVIWVPGNHDTTMSFFAFEALRGWYNSDPNVSIDKDIKRRSYRLEGVNLLGFAHGDKVKALHEIMQHEAKELWGQSLYAEMITAHFHAEKVKEDKGVTVRTASSLSGTDSWHYEKGFTGSRIAAQGIIYKRDHIGPYSVFHESINILEEPDQK